MWGEGFYFHARFERKGKEFWRRLLFDCIKYVCMANKIASSASFFGRTVAARPNGKKINEVLLFLNESEQILFYAHQAEDHLKTGAEQVRRGEEDNIYVYGGAKQGLLF